jgi:Zn-dependent protease
VLLSRDPSVLIVIALIFIVCLPFHEFSHALAAFRLGDNTARLMGRLTLNPLAHIDPMGALMILAVGFGWAKPTPYNPYNIRYGRNGEAIIAFAGPASNLVLATAAAIPLRYIVTARMDVPPILEGTLSFFVLFNLALMAFNLIPIPPLDGSKILFALLDPQTERQYRPVIEQYGPFLLLLVVFSSYVGGPSLIGSLYDSVVGPLYSFLVGIPSPFG